MDVSWDTQAGPYTTDFEDFVFRAGGAAESVSRQIVDDAICDSDVGQFKRHMVF